MERIHFPTAKPIMLNKLEGKPALLLVFKENKLDPEQSFIDARWDMDTVVEIANAGYLTGMIKILNDSITQLIDIKLAGENKIRKELSKKSILTS